MFPSWAIHSQGQQEAKNGDTNKMQKMFRSLHCKESNAEAIKAFEGCWKVGAVWGAPIDENLKLGLRSSADRFQLWLDSHSAQQAADSNNPRFCNVGEDVYSAAPYPDADFNHAYTYAYYILDIPPEDAERIARIYFDSHERKMPWEEYKGNFVEFSKKGGKYVRTLIIHGPEFVGWDTDGEEDFWILPVVCDGWEKVEARIKQKRKQANKPQG